VENITEENLFISKMLNRKSVPDTDGEFQYEFAVDMEFVHVEEKEDQET